MKRVVAGLGAFVKPWRFGPPDKELFINGQAVGETYSVHNQAEVMPAGDNPRDNFGPVTVPPDSYFVMGDNRKTKALTAGFPAPWTRPGSKARSEAFIGHGTTKGFDLRAAAIIRQIEPDLMQSSPVIVRPLTMK